MAIPMKTLQTADRVLGRAACLLLQPLRWTRFLRRRRDPIQRVLLIKFWGLGSLELLTPAVATLRRRHPQARLDLLTLSQNEGFARGLGVFDGVRTFEVGADSWRLVFGHILGLIASLRRERYDVVYDFEFFTRFSAVITLLSRAPVARGFSAPQVWRGGFHTETAPFNRFWQVARNFRCLAGGENGAEIAPGDLRPFRAGPADELEVTAALFEEGLAADGPLVVVNPNAGTLSLERRWPQERFAELARTLAREDGARVVLIGGPGERAWTDEVAAKVGPTPPERLANLAGRLSIGGLHALLTHADAFVSNDSGPMHLGAALGTPTIGLFGPETPIMYRPIGRRASYLYDPPPCSPCINVHDNKFAVCWRGRPECLMNLSVPRVLAQVRQELERGPEPARREEPAPRG